MPTPIERKALSHVERTAQEPRDESVYRVRLERIDQINEEIRLLRLAPVEGGFRFLPGQWLDVHVPSIPKAGGFTITSPPALVSSHTHPYLELAIQRSPSNPAAAWLWRPSSDILHSELRVRVGGSFVWPPKLFSRAEMKRVVFVAGGVGINPLMSMMSHLAQQPSLPFAIKFLYTLRDPGPDRDASRILFLERLAEIFKKFRSPDKSLELFLTGKDGHGIVPCSSGELAFHGRRITTEDLLEALGPVEERDGTAVYVCGVPEMTDQFVKLAGEAEGIDERQVLCEKWW